MVRYWIAAGIVLILFIVVLSLWMLMRQNQRWSHSIIAHAILTLFLFALIFTVKQVGLLLLDSYHTSLITPSMLDTISIIAMMLVALQQLFHLINRLTHSQIQKGDDPTNARMISRILKLGIALFLMLLFGEHLGISLSGLLAFGGIGGVAIGIAGRDVLSNLFSGIMLYFDRPFNIGDWISSPDRQIEGTVAEIGWRLTKIITFDKRPLYIPNSLFSTISVENPGRMTNRRIDTSIGLRYEDADKIGDIVKEIKLWISNNDKIDHNQTTLIYFNSFGESSLDIMIYCFTKTTVWAEWLEIQQDVYLNIINIVKANGADFAFPSRTLYFDQTGDPTNSPQQTAALSAQ